MQSLFPVVGFHGCSRETAEKIIFGKEPLSASKTRYEWLGDGIYFWENDPVRALEWAKYRKFENPYVIGALIAPTEILDFSTRESVPLLQAAADMLTRQKGIRLPKNKSFGEGDKFYKRRELDCLIMNAVHEGNKGPDGKGRFDVFRAPFLEGETVYDGGTFRRETHVQLCVKNPDCIVGAFVPVRELEALGLPPL